MKKAKTRLNQLAQDIGITSLGGEVGIKAFNSTLESNLPEDVKAAIRSDALHLTKLGGNNPLSSLVFYLNSIGIFPQSPIKAKSSLKIEQENALQSIVDRKAALIVERKAIKGKDDAAKAAKLAIDDKIEAINKEKAPIVTKYRDLLQAQFKEQKASKEEGKKAKMAANKQFKEDLKGLPLEEQKVKQEAKDLADAANTEGTYRALEGFAPCDKSLQSIISTLFDMGIDADGIKTYISGGVPKGSVLDWLTSRVRGIPDQTDEQLRLMFRAVDMSQEQCTEIRSLCSDIGDPQWIASSNFSRDTRILMGANASWFSNLVNGLEDFEELGPIAVDFTKVPDSIIDDLGFKRVAIEGMATQAQTLADLAVKASKAMLSGEGSAGCFAAIEEFQRYFEKDYTPMLGQIIGRLKTHKLLKEADIRIPAVPKRLAKQPLTNDHQALAAQAQVDFDKQLSIISTLELNNEVRFRSAEEFQQFVRTIRSTLHGNDINIAITELKLAQVCANDEDLYKFFKGNYRRDGQLVHSNDRQGYGYFWTGERAPKFTPYGVNLHKLVNFDPVAFVDYFLNKAKTEDKIALTADLIRWKININSRLIEDGDARSEMALQGTLLQSYAKNTNPKSQYLAHQVPFEPDNVNYCLSPRENEKVKVHPVQHRSLIAHDLLVTEGKHKKFVNVAATFAKTTAFVNDQFKSRNVGAKSVWQNHKDLHDITKHLANLPHDLWVSVRVKNGGSTRPVASYAFESKGAPTQSKCHQWFRITGDSARKRPFYQVAFGRGIAAGVRVTLLENDSEAKLKLTVPFTINEVITKVEIPNILFFDLNMYGIYFRVEDGQGNHIETGFEACDIPHILSANENKWRKEKALRIRHEYLKTSKERERATGSGQYIGLIWKLVDKYRAAPVFENNISGLESGGNRMKAIWKTVITAFVGGDIDADKKRYYDNLNVGSVGSWEKSLIHPSIFWKANSKMRAFRSFGTTVKGAYTSITCPCCERAASLEIRGAKSYIAEGDVVEIINSDGDTVRFDTGKTFKTRTELTAEDMFKLFPRTRSRGKRSDKQAGDSNHSAFYCFNVDCEDFKKEQHADKNATLNLSKNFWKVNEYRKPV